MKQTVKVVKRMADWSWGEQLGNDFENNKQMFCRGKVGEQAKDALVKDVNGQYCDMVLR